MISLRSYYLAMLISIGCTLWASLASAEPQGGIEIGAKGIKTIVVDVVEGNLKILSVDTKNTTLVADLAAKKQFVAKSLDETAEAVAKSVKKIHEEFKVAEKRIYVVGSSGLFAPLNGDEKLIKANKELLVDAIRKSSTLMMDFISFTREAELTVASIVPTGLRDESVLLDIGSGNTKGGAEQKGSGFVSFGIPYGTISFFDRVNKEANKDDFFKTAVRLRNELVLPKLQESLKDKPELAKRKRVYLSGGTIWSLTTFEKPADRGSMVPLTLSDFASFSKFLRENTNELPNADLSRVADSEVKKLAIEDMNQVRKTFTPVQLIAGMEILNSLVEGFQLSAPNKQLFFARNAYIGWILGYLIEKDVVSK
jgi:exopolyphosphatase/pppGpp-phosphohydrolase